MIILSWIVLIYSIIAIVVFFTLPYRNDVPQIERFLVSVFWLPIFIALGISNL